MEPEQVPETSLLCLSLAAARSNLVVVMASVKGYQEPMTVLTDSGASIHFATKASVARNSALYASALEAYHGNTDFDDFDSVEPFIVLDMDDRYDLVRGMLWLAKHEPWIDWRSQIIGDRL
ncbi:unnamed protein product [Phytophthora fragariaefolia]|uniref:Unnamed protein product n=1 Tax=Phytophthora fragariaefolia TaxID=1490495 RepID=A0A9W6X6L3_9STRA|nr:unnamed protein product [Phytophthora fragariaefolia]